MGPQNQRKLRHILPVEETSVSPLIRIRAIHNNLQWIVHKGVACGEAVAVTLYFVPELTRKRNDPITGSPRVSGAAIHLGPDEQAVWLTDKKDLDCATLTGDALPLADTAHRLRRTKPPAESQRTRRESSFTRQTRSPTISPLTESQGRAALSQPYEVIDQLGRGHA